MSSSCVQYTEAIPNSEGENPSTPHKHPPVAKAADNGGASAPTDKAGKPASDGQTDESSGNESSNEGGATLAGNGNGGGTGQGKPAGSANNGSTPQAQHGGQSAGTPASQSSSGSSSSPLIPILIGIVVLAAISVGAVMYRQRRQQRGPTASSPSPKAS